MTAQLIATQFPGHVCMDNLTTGRSFDSHITWVIDVLGLFFDMSSMGVFTTRHCQTSGRLVQELNSELQLWNKVNQELAHSLFGCSCFVTICNISSRICISLYHLHSPIKLQHSPYSKSITIALFVAKEDIPITIILIWPTLQRTKNWLKSNCCPYCCINSINLCTHIVLSNISLLLIAYPSCHTQTCVYRSIALPSPTSTV